ncbi:hypothetical protein SLOPH_1851 [Spraguea lophii 42_110]|uniref:Uncharacterized protein n=1 Tax=Spraguea lophii (strain 42_110) TaxID=1358809 RepID=S7W6E2_SPRLO|nr:hypothetical protein SLOPH_1851 [Spraguea lophii 42_110]
MDRIDKFLNLRQSPNSRTIKHKNKTYTITKSDIKQLKTYRTNNCLEKINFTPPNNTAFSRIKQTHPLQNHKAEEKRLKSKNIIRPPKKIIKKKKYKESDIWPTEKFDFVKNIPISISNPYDSISNIFLDKDNLKKIINELEDKYFITNNITNKDVKKILSNKNIIEYKLIDKLPIEYNNISINCKFMINSDINNINVINSYNLNVIKEIKNIKEMTNNKNYNDVKYGCINMIEDKIILTEEKIKNIQIIEDTVYFIFNNKIGYSKLTEYNKFNYDGDDYNGIKNYINYYGLKSVNTLDSFKEILSFKIIDNKFYILRNNELIIYSNTDKKILEKKGMNNISNILDLRCNNYVIFVGIMSIHYLSTINFEIGLVRITENILYSFSHDVLPLVCLIHEEYVVILEINNGVKINKKISGRFVSGVFDRKFRWLYLIGEDKHIYHYVDVL